MEMDEVIEWFFYGVSVTGSVFFIVLALLFLVPLGHASDPLGFFEDRSPKWRTHRRKKFGLMKGLLIFFTWLAFGGLLAYGLETFLWFLPEANRDTYRSPEGMTTDGVAWGISSLAFLYLLQAAEESVTYRREFPGSIETISDLKELLRPSAKPMDERLSDMIQKIEAEQGNVSLEARRRSMEIRLQHLREIQRSGGHA
jgi:hypothetical protein